MTIDHSQGYSYRRKPISLLDLDRQYSQIQVELEEAVLSVLRSGSYILGKNVKALEEDVSQYCGAEYGIGVANGTDALILALWALDIGPGDEVITSPFTFAATVEAILLRGATPVFADIDPASFNICPHSVEAAITSKTKAIIPVHLYGQPADMGPILQLAADHKLKIIEDAAQAIGAKYKGRPAGSMGDLACLSFYPTKNLGACGDAGMILTRDGKLAERVRALRAHGSHTRYHHTELGVNSRLDEVQAAILRVKLKRLDFWNNARRQIAAFYSKVLGTSRRISVPTVAPDTTHVWHQYTIRIHGSAGQLGAERDRAKAFLDGESVGSMCYYPIPLHLQSAYTSLGYKTGDFPEAERAASEVLSLPMYPELKDIELEQVCSLVKQAVGEETTNVIPARPGHVLSGGQL